MGSFRRYKLRLPSLLLRALIMGAGVWLLQACAQVIADSLYEQTERTRVQPPGWVSESALRTSDARRRYWVVHVRGLRELDAAVLRHVQAFLADRLHAQFESVRYHTFWSCPVSQSLVSDRMTSSLASKLIHVFVDPSELGLQEAPTWASRRKFLFEIPLHSRPGLGFGAIKAGVEDVYFERWSPVTAGAVVQDVYDLHVLVALWQPPSRSRSVEEGEPCSKSVP